MAGMAMMTFSCSETPASVRTVQISRIDSVQTRLTQHINAARVFLASRGFSEEFCLLVDFRRRSGDNRFIFYNLHRDSVEFVGKVAHGRCNEGWLEVSRYSNEQGSGCSSLGKYRIGQKYNGQFGLAYKLHGLDSGNSNAYYAT
jgi:hypothetical protein